MFFHTPLCVSLSHTLSGAVSSSFTSLLFLFPRHIPHALPFFVTFSASLSTVLFPSRSPVGLSQQFSIDPLKLCSAGQLTGSVILNDHSAQDVSSRQAHPRDLGLRRSGDISLKMACKLTQRAGGPE